MDDHDIIPCFWFNGCAEQAVDFYLSIFPNGEIISQTFHGKDAPLGPGTPMSILFCMQGLNDKGCTYIQEFSRQLLIVVGKTSLDATFRRGGR